MVIKNAVVYQRLVAALVLAILPGMAAVQAAVDAQFDRLQVAHGESVILSIESDRATGGVQPDLTPLNRDFDIAGVSTSTSTNWVNGRHSSSTRWDVQLFPKRPGRVTVAPIAVAGERTGALALEVVAGGAGVAGTATAGSATLSIDADIAGDSETHFVQQQLTLTVRVRSAAPLLEGSLTDPEVGDAIIERLGDDRRYSSLIDGHSYNVVERRFALFPMRSGTLEILPLVFDGRVASDGNHGAPRSRADIWQRLFGADPFFGGNPFAATAQRVRIESEPIKIEIAPQPAQYTADHWLPARSLVLEDSWQKTPPALVGGEPQTRQITVRAEGLAASQLPEIVPPRIAGLTVYAEPAVNETTVLGDRVVATSRQNYTYLPSQSGPLELPAVSLDWWSVTEQRQRTAMLDALHLDVQPGNEMTEADRAEPNGMTPSPTLAPKAAPDGDSAVPLPPAQFAALVFAAIALVAMVGGFLLFRDAGRREVKGINDSSRAAGQSVARSWKQVRKACAADDPIAAERALLAWAAIVLRTDAPASLTALSYVLPSPPAEAVAALERHRYGVGRSGAWDGAALWRALDCLPRNWHRQQPTPVVNTLRPLYPRP